MARLGAPPLPQVAGEIPRALADAEARLVHGDLEEARQLSLAVIETVKGGPESVESDAYRKRAEELLAEANRQELAVVQEKIAAARETALETGYDAARNVLLNYLGATPYTPYRKEVEAVLAEFDEEEARQAELAANASKRSYEEIFRAANRAFDEGRYEEAIENYRLLAKIEEYREQVALLLPESIDRLVKERRSTASKLFAQARSVEDPVQKFELLAKSYKILKETLLAYPDAKYSPKLRKNLEVVHAEIARIRPGFEEGDLEEMIDTGEGEDGEDAGDAAGGV